MSKVWLITGSSRGLGRAIARYALDAGHKVILTARKTADLADLAGSYPETQVLALALDVTKLEVVQASIASGIERFGHIDIVVNNAGYADSVSVEDSDMDTFRQQFETNFYGVVNVSKTVLPILREQKSGHIFQVSSLGGRASSPGLSAYQSAKWAVGGFSGCLAAEVKHLGIKITVLEPGAMRTDWAGSSMRTPPASEPYNELLKKFAEVRDQAMQAKVTKIENVGPLIWRLFNEVDPPLRIVLGADAVAYAERIAEALSASDAKWKAVGESTSD